MAMYILCKSTYRSTIYLCEGVVKMDHDYRNVEYANINFMYGKVNSNALGAARLYAEVFPHRRHPDRLSSITSNIEERGDVNPGTSTRRMTMQQGISAISVWRILHSQLLYPYQIQRVQGLKNTDLLPRLNFCQQIQHQ
ncbi:hypothetical protein PR048_001439 [Dryococelus australis]|uniref:DUF4817 domain-containing protein n=1 Tax=Dryococelus australis TaxID=614101 RepID=A0ABQ9IHF9_9NEOP|nr:hypothetical protein PR048_001439 [Dryococelus australis]